MLTRCYNWKCSVFVCLIAILGYFYMGHNQHHIPEEVTLHLGVAGIQMFKAYDRNDDGYLSLEEFEPMFHYITEKGQNGSLLGLTNYDQPIRDDDEVITVVARFSPLVLSSMKRDSNADLNYMWNSISIKDAVTKAMHALHDGIRFLYGAMNPLFGLRTWLSPHKEWMNFGVRHFKLFFPPNDNDVGNVYHMIEDSQGFFQRMFTNDLSSNRYYPPFVSERDQIVHRLLAMFHPQPFILTRFRPRGSYAVVRAKNDQYLDIVFRIHAEFQLNDLPNLPFWFTPAQFTGNLIVTKDLRRIVHLNMYVPASRKLNVDMEWLEGRENMVVDIGYMPEMSLHNTAPSLPAKDLNRTDKIPYDPFSTKDIKWSYEITQEKALSLLEVQMFPFKKVPYYNFSDTLKLAGESDKYIHHILLWGALDDQSC